MGERNSIEMYQITEKCLSWVEILKLKRINFLLRFYCFLGGIRQDWKKIQLLEQTDVAYQWKQRALLWRFSYHVTQQWPPCNKTCGWGRVSPHSTIVLWKHLYLQAMFKLKSDHTPCPRRTSSCQNKSSFVTFDPSPVELQKFFASFCSAENADRII